jgi:RHS repeat-associated protein
MELKVRALREKIAASIGEDLKLEGFMIDKSLTWLKKTVNKKNKIGAFVDVYNYAPVRLEFTLAFQFLIDEIEQERQKILLFNKQEYTINFNIIFSEGYFHPKTKQLELSNHLGNVLVTVSDKKIGVDNNADGIIDYYTADVISAQDYAPFGSLLPGRQYGTKGRYLFNGKEQDPEAKGTGSQYDYGFRIYDPRLGRFLSVDPLTKEYPMLSPYPFAENQPIWAIDIDGLEKYIVINYLNKKGEIYKTEIRGIRSIDGKNAVNMQMKNAHGKSLTTKDVYVVNQLANGKFQDVGGKNSLSPEEQKIYNKVKTIAPENNDEGDSDLPFEDNISDQAETQKGTFTSKLFDGGKFEFFGVSQKIAIPKIVSNPESNKPRQYNDNDNNAVGSAGDLIVRDVNKIVADFKTANPKAADIKTSVLFTTTSSNANFVNQVAKRLEALGVKTKVVTDDKYRNVPTPGNTPSKQDFNFATTVTGVIK